VHHNPTACCVTYICCRSIESMILYIFPHGGVATNLQVVEIGVWVMPTYWIQDVASVQRVDPFGRPGKRRYKIMNTSRCNLISTKSGGLYSLTIGGVRYLMIPMQRTSSVTVTTPANGHFLQPASRKRYRFSLPRIHHV
jgi:hypothetical protein